MTTTATGRHAEQKAAEFLAREGFEILEQNYRRPHCEIDIVARRGDVVYIVEVKYRATNRAGSGLEYITADKLRRMQRAAQTWALNHCWSGEIELSAIEVGGSDFEVMNFIESVY